MKAPHTSDELTTQLAALKDVPGVYIFKSVDDEIIYIGKALSLKSRVRSYWNEASWRERPKLAVMMPRVAILETIITNSEKEALLLESTLIRQHKPRYNVALKDDRRYPWLAITYDVAYPRLVMVRDPVRYRKENPKAKVFGPYVETGQMWETVKVLRKVFPMRQRRTPFFKDRPCMNFHIGLCLGPCQKLVEEDFYNRMVAQVELFLAGRQTEVVSQLKKDMEDCSERLEFEQAAKIRDRLVALQTVLDKQQVFFASNKVNQDVIAEAHTSKILAVCLIRVREGKMISSEVVCIPLVDRTGWDEAYQSFVDQYYTSCESVTIPQEVLSQHELDDMDALSELLASRSGHAAKVLVPQKGAKLDIIQMAKKNAENHLEQEIARVDAEDSRTTMMLSTLQEQLGVKRPPKRIECFDISNIQGTDNVASMVVAENGKAKKSDYRLFKIKSVEGTPNDFQSMKEVVGRRYLRLLEENKPFPDLIIIDGGKGQLGAAMEALAELDAKGLNRDSFEIIGLAKKQEEVYFPNKSSPVLLPRRSEALFLLQRVRDEAHRFAITYHRKLRAKRSLISGFDSLPGVGKARRKMLLDHFGTFDALKNASLDDLKNAPGINKKLAETIWTTLHPTTAATVLPTVETTEPESLPTASDEGENAVEIEGEDDDPEDDETEDYLEPEAVGET